MSLNMHGTQYGLTQHNKILQDFEVGYVVNNKLPLFGLCSVALRTAVVCINA